MSKTAYDENTSVEAGAWLARLQSDSLSFRDHAAFQTWLSSSPARAAAFEDATNIWDRLGAIPRDAYVREVEANRPSRRAFLAGAAALAVAGAAVPFLFGSAKAQTYQTGIGEQKQIELPDNGTIMLLDTDTCVSVRFDSDIRLLELKYGRINCRVAPDPRQFAVGGTERLVVSNKSVFDLSDLDNCFSVLLIKGNATINSVNGPFYVGPGERAFASGSHPLKRDRPAISLLTAWQTGRLVFKDETVGEAAKEMNRYSTVKLEIMDPQLASKRISGGYRAGDNADFAESLARLFSVEVIHRNGVIQLVSRSAI